jgi:hypothetical protein
MLSLLRNTFAHCSCRTQCWLQQEPVLAKLVTGDQDGGGVMCCEHFVTGSTRIDSNAEQRVLQQVLGEGALADFENRSDLLRRLVYEKGVLF